VKSPSPSGASASDGAAFWAATAGVCSIAAFLFYDLAFFPGLHGDEAWIGLYAGRVLSGGLTTPHLMNDYTGALFGWAVAAIFRVFGPSVFTLRLLSASLNAAAAVGFVLWARRSFGPRAAVAMTGLLASSAMFLFYGRVAWEVCAFENALVLAVLWSCRTFIEEDRFPPASVLTFFGAIAFGSINHFIFLSVPLSLFVYSIAAAAFWGDRDARRLRPLFAFAVLLGGICYLKRFLSPEAFAARPLLFIGGFAALVPTFTVAFLSWQGGLPGAGVLQIPLVRRAAAIVLGLGAAAFSIWHLPALIQILSGVSLLRRVTALDPIWPLRWALYLWGAWLAAALITRTTLFASRPGAAAGPRYARFVLLWAAAYCSTFILIRNTSSIRYYLLAHALFLSALSFVLGERRWSPRALTLAGLIVVGLHGFYWSEAARRVERRPIVFRTGFRKEKSIDFIYKDSLFERLDRDRVCVWDHSKQDFLYIPAIFHRQGTPVDCDPSKVLELEYCRECERPPYYTYTLRSNAT